MCSNILLALALSQGCGTGEGRLIVSGTVAYSDGSPITAESGTIIFHPVDEAGQPANGPVGEDGSFELMTRAPGDGVAPGQYKVVLKIWKSYRDQTPSVATEYGDAATTPLTATVDRNSSTFKFNVERP
jgi:hypothetical protein